MSRQGSGEFDASDARRLDERLERMELALGLAKPEPTISGAVADLSEAIRNSGDSVDCITSSPDGAIELTMRTSEDSGIVYTASEGRAGHQTVGLREPRCGARKEEGSGHLRNANNVRIMGLREKPDETLAESTDKRCAVLLHMILEMSAANAHCDHITLQLTTYLLTCLGDPGLGYEHCLDDYGPNCRDVQRDINSLFCDLVDGTHRLRGRNLLVLPKGEEFLRHFPSTIEQCEPGLGVAVGMAVTRPRHELTYLTTAMFLLRTGRGRSMSPSEAADHYIGIRKYADKQSVRKAVAEARALLSKAPAEDTDHA